MLSSEALKAGAEGSSKWDRVSKMSDDKNLYRNLCSSLFPTIHGNEEIKRGILLQLFGGVPKVTEEGTSLRGDLNVCIVGDPSTAKSQFLKSVSLLVVLLCQLEIVRCLFDNELKDYPLVFKKNRFTIVACCSRFVNLTAVLLQQV